MDITSKINSSIPGFSGLSSSASDLIRQLMSGQLTTGERSAIYNAGAERGVMGGMPGSSAQGGSLYANADLRNIGLESGKRQQQGFQDLLGMLQGYSGNVFTNAAQDQQQEQQNQQFNANLAFQRSEANAQRLHQTQMQAAEADARNYWDPRWRSRNPYTPGVQIGSTSKNWFQGPNVL